MPGRPSQICLFAQYHPANRLRPPLLAYVSALRDAGYHVYLAASGTAPPPPEDQAALAATGATLFCRANAGLDFGAWQFLVAQGCADHADRILLANDSVFGPFAPLPPILERMNGGGHDVWGMIESEQRGWHLQSWFLHFTGTAFRHPAIQAVFARDFAAMDKEDVIGNGELALGQALRQAGLRCGAVVRHADANWFARRHRINMMHLDWRHNLRALGLPFVKAELLRDNPMRLPWAPAWPHALPEAEIAGISDYLKDYTAQPGPGRYRTPTKPISIRLALGYTLATHDRALALRSLRPWNLRLTMGPEKLRSAR